MEGNGVGVGVLDGEKMGWTGGFKEIQRIVVMRMFGLGGQTYDYLWGCGWVVDPQNYEFW